MPTTPQIIYPSDTPELYPYQKSGVKYAVNKRRWIFNDEMGLGKSAEAIIAARLLKAERVLIVTPAIVRRNWEKELHTWWPTGPQPGVILLGRKRLTGVSKEAQKTRDSAYLAPIQIVSFSLIQEVDVAPWDVIIFDESHRLQGVDTVQAKICRQIARTNRSAAIFALTATLMPKRPLDAWTTLDILQPGQWGRYRGGHWAPWAFAQHYTLMEHNGYGWVSKGVREENIDEFKQRLSLISSRATKKEFAHLFPTFLVQSQSVPADVDFKKSVTDWLYDASKSATHIAVLTYLRESVVEFAKLAGNDLGGTPVFQISGVLTAEKRLETLERAKNAKNAIVVATMSSVGVGIDMTFCTQVAIVELYDKPETLIQLLGRFSRLTSVVPSSVTFLVQEGSQDEKISWNLVKELEEINKAIKAGDTEGKLVSALNIEMSEEQFAAKLQNIFATARKSDA